LELSYQLAAKDGYALPKNVTMLSSTMPVELAKDIAQQFELTMFSEISIADTAKTHRCRIIFTVKGNSVRASYLPLN
jgi:hypothetical protein